MPPSRDPLSVQYDPFTHRLLRQAIRSKSAPRVAEAFIQSPPREFVALDYGRRTAHERAFTRSVYYLVLKVPQNMGAVPLWSAKLTWGPIERRGGRWGRGVRVRLFRYGSGQRYVSEHMARDPWSEDIDGTGSWRAGTRRSVPGQRIDSGRRAL